MAARDGTGRGTRGRAEGRTQGCRDVWLQAADMELLQASDRDDLPPSEGIWGQDIGVLQFTAAGCPQSRTAFSACLAAIKRHSCYFCPSFYR